MQFYSYRRGDAPSKDDSPIKTNIDGTYEGTFSLTAKSKYPFELKVKRKNKNAVTGTIEVQLIPKASFIKMIDITGNLKEIKGNVILKISLTPNADKEKLGKQLSLADPRLNTSKKIAVAIKLILDGFEQALEKQKDTLDTLKVLKNGDVLEDTKGNKYTKKK